MAVETIKCSRCKRDWPKVSSQGIHTELFKQCHGCTVTRVMKIAADRQAKVDYAIENCYVCAGIKFADCVTCDGTGWIADDKK